MSGTLLDSSVLSTRSALLVQVAVISLRYFALAAPSFFCSGMATATLPPSSTSWPRASRRASSPATRTADGPMSTPRRDWPRSRGTPITRIFFGTMLEKDVVVGAISFLFAAKNALTTKGTKVHKGKKQARKSHSYVRQDATDRSCAAFLEMESSPARAPGRRSKLRLVQFPCRIQHVGRRRTCADPSTI